MRSRTPKYLHDIGGKPFIDHIIDTCNKLGFSRKIIVTNPQFKIKRKGWDNAVQAVPRGTGDAVLAAKAALEGFAGDVLVLYSDSPFISRETIARMMEKKRQKSDIVSLVFHAENPGAYGRIIAGKDDRIEKIVEASDATDEQKKITLCNSGHLACDADLLFSLLAKVGNNNPAGEYWLTDIIGIATAEGKECRFVIGDESEIMGVNTRAEMALAEAEFQKRKRREVMDSGVTLMSPETTFFSYDTVIGQDCIVEPGVYFAPGAYVEPNTRIPAFSRVDGHKMQHIRHPGSVFSFKMIMSLLFIVMLILSPLWIWVAADNEKKGLCSRSLEMCLIHSKNTDSEMGVFGCAFSNMKCLARDINVMLAEEQSLPEQETEDFQDLEEFLKNR